MTGLPTTPVSPLAVSWTPATDRGRHRTLLRALFVEELQIEPESMSDERAS
jgi:hypothetical protein